MGRVEETDKYLKEVEDEACAAIRSSGSELTIIAQTIALQTASNEAIAKNLAQLADDIHFIKEILAKELENDEVPSARRRQAGAKCMDCRHCEFARVDKNGVIRPEAYWCHRKGIEIVSEDRPVCGYFEYRDKGGE